MTCQVREVAKSIEGERPSVPLEPYNVRITSGGRLKGWVDFSLKFFAENPGKPLVFHTLPRETVHLEDVDMSVEKDVTDKTSKALPVGTDGDSDTESITPRRSKSAVTSNVPRLVSVVEIIKREYLKSLPPGPRQSLHQYNQLQFLENTTDSADGSEDTRMREILAALEGKNQCTEQLI
ncbi:hypothetical protein BD410DRAFT_204095 [Rickenella mellea]|uniref:Uncharacterized protein n=1 Tax=Rickenella mellea TaxID=50990 RepID=A0A4Y7PG97_9AGAM|nr:hypothetical protein BD410DRAFT_204095 [Rickenella mellea]